MAKITVIGAGAAGLAAAWRLAGKHDVTLLEVENDTGGMGGKWDVDWDGKKYSVNKTYHHILKGDATTIRFARELGLEVKFRKVKQGFIYNGKIHRFSSPIDILRFPLPISSKIRLAKFTLFDVKRADWDSLTGKTASEWIVSKAGKKNYDIFFDQLMRNKFHAEPSTISAPWFGTRFVKESSSFLAKFGAIDGGQGMILEKMAQELPRRGVKIITGARAEKIELGKIKRVSYSAGGKKHATDSDAIISTVAPEVFLSMVQCEPAIEKQLRDMRYLSCICLTFGVRKEFNDIYWTNVLDKDVPFSVMFNQTALYKDAPEGKQIFYIARYLDKKEHQWKMSDEELKRLYLKKADSFLPGFSEAVEWSRIVRFEHAEAIYSMGFQNPPVRAGEGLYLAGIFKIFPRVRNVASALEEGEAAAKAVEEDVGG
ncbi:MAG: FAD-dependent oxidoreductase [Candidatus Aenigmatarchaeota archaeon]